MVLGQFPDGHFPDGHFPEIIFPDGQFPEGQFPERTFPRTDISPNHIFHLFKSFIYRWYIKVAEANEFQQH